VDLTGLGNAMDTITEFITKTSALLTTLAAGVFAFYAWLKSRSSDHSAKRARAAAEIAERTLHTTVNQYAAQLVIEAGKMFIDHPQLRPYFFHGKPWPEPQPADLQLALAIGQSHLDVMETIWDHHEDIDADDVDAWREWMHEVMEAPIVQRGYEPRWYPSITQMLEEHGCSNRRAHSFASDKGDLHANKSVSFALNRLSELQAGETFISDDVVPLIADAAEAEYRFKYLRQLDAKRGLEQRLRDAEVDGNEDQVELLKEELAAADFGAKNSLRRAIVLAAAYERHSPSTLPPLYSLSGITERTRSMLARLLRVTIPPLTQPARPTALHDLIWSDAHQSDAADGRSRTLRGAVEFATDIHPSP
jgi:hypothetical protein